MKRALSLLCAMALVVTMTVVSTLSVSAASTNFVGLDKAVCVLPEEVPWNSRSSGLFETNTMGHGLMVTGHNTDMTLTADLGSYSINNSFKATFDLWYQGRSIDKGAVEGNENWIVSFGDLDVIFSRSPKDNSTGANNLFLYSVKYKDTEVAVTGEKQFKWGMFTEYKFSSDEYVKSRQEINDYLDGNMMPVDWMIKPPQSFFPNLKLSIEVAYESGKLTIKNTGGTENVLTADLTKVAGFDAATAFKTTKLSATLDVKADRVCFAPIIANFAGSCDGSLISLPTPPVVETPAESETPTSSEPTSSEESSEATSSEAESEEPTSSEVNSEVPDDTNTDTDTDIDADADADTDEKGNNLVTVIIIVVAAVVVLGGGAAAFFLLRKKGAAPAEAAEDAAEETEETTEDNSENE